MCDRLFPAAVLRSEAAVLEIGEGGLVRRDHAGAGSGFDAHVAQRHAAFDRKSADGFSGVFDDVSGGAVGADLSDDAERQVFGGHAFGEFSPNVDQHGFRFALRQALRGQHVLDFGCANAERQRSERAVRAGVAVAADDRHAGLGKSEFRADYVDDALVGRVHVEQRNAEFLAIFLQGLDLEGGNRVGNWRAAGLGRDVVIDRGDGPVGLAYAASGRTEAVKRLRRSHLVDQMQVYIKKRQAVWRRRDYVLVPDFLE